MAGDKNGTKCCAASILSNLSPRDFRYCVKCAELEIQLQRSLDELSSAQLIVEMLKKKYVQEDCATSLTQHVGADSEGDISWIEVTPKGFRRRTEGNVEVLNPNELTMTVNSYDALASECTVACKKSGLKSVCENKLKVINNSQKDKLSYNERNRKTIMQHNRQNSRLIGHEDKIKAGNGNLPYSKHSEWTTIKKKHK
jgi:hypothetical protein